MNLRMVLALILAAIAVVRMQGCEMPDFGQVLPVPDGGSEIAADVPVWLVVVEEKSNRPKGMAAFERSDFRSMLGDSKVKYLNVNDDDATRPAADYVQALGGDVPGYLLIHGESGEVIDSGKVPDPVSPEFFRSLVQRELGR